MTHQQQEERALVSEISAHTINTLGTHPAVFNPRSFTLCVGFGEQPHPSALEAPQQPGRGLHFVADVALCCTRWVAAAAETGWRTREALHSFASAAVVCAYTTTLHSFSVAGGPVTAQEHGTLTRCLASLGTLRPCKPLHRPKKHVILLLGAAMVSFAH